jgi:hypothetical protein
MLKTLNISFVSLALLAGFHSQVQAADVCLPEAAKSTAELFAKLSAITKLCDRGTALETDNSRKELLTNVSEIYPCTKDTFAKWYDDYFNEAELTWSTASKAQQQQLCADGPKQAISVPMELLKELLKGFPQKVKQLVFIA